MDRKRTAWIRSRVAGTEHRDPGRPLCRAGARFCPGGKRRPNAQVLRAGALYYDRSLRREFAAAGHPANSLDVVAGDQCISVGDGQTGHGHADGHSGHGDAYGHADGPALGAADDVTRCLCVSGGNVRDSRCHGGVGDTELVRCAVRILVGYSDGNPRGISGGHPSRHIERRARGECVPRRERNAESSGRGRFDGGRNSIADSGRDIFVPHFQRIGPWTAVRERILSGGFGVIHGYVVIGNSSTTDGHIDTGDVNTVDGHTDTVTVTGTHIRPERPPVNQLWSDIGRCRTECFDADARLAGLGDTRTFTDALTEGLRFLDCSCDALRSIPECVASYSV
jgi:hypothetical protein